MKKAFLPEITYMRGLCMLGVIGIHVGSYALQNPFVNLELISVLEILSRFGVPAFFFLSAFGLFYHTSVDGPPHSGGAISIYYVVHLLLALYGIDGAQPRQFTSGSIGDKSTLWYLYVSFVFYGYFAMVLRDDAVMAGNGESHPQATCVLDGVIICCPSRY